MLQRGGRPREAAAAPRTRARRSARRTSVPDHRDVGAHPRGPRLRARRSGQVSRAQQLATRAVRIWESLDTPEAPEFATVLALYADLRRAAVTLAAARDYYGRALAIRGKVFGRTNPSTLKAQVGLAAVLASLARTPALSTTAIRPRHRPRSPPTDAALAAGASGASVCDGAPSRAEPDAVTGGRGAGGRARGRGWTCSSRALVLDEMAARRGVGQRARGRERRAPADMGSVRSNGSPTYSSVALERCRPRNTRRSWTTPGRKARRPSRALAEQSASFRAERSRAQIGAEDVIDGAARRRGAGGVRTLRTHARARPPCR